MRERSATAIGLVALIALSGCAAMQERRWSYCAVAGGLIGAAAGAGTAGGLVNAYEGGDGGNRKETGAAAGSGAVVGAGVGTLLGHLICDPKEEVPPPPPVAQIPPPPPPPKGTKLATVGEAFFDFNKAQLKPSAEDVLAEAVRTLKQNPDMRITVEGHTDSIGSVAYNQKLSEKRAEAVKRYLVSQGIESSRINVEGFGKSRPVASNQTAEGRAKNRRAELVVD